MSRGSDHRHASSSSSHTHSGPPSPPGRSRAATAAVGGGGVSGDVAAASTGLRLLLDLSSASSEDGSCSTGGSFGLTALRESVGLPEDGGGGVVGGGCGGGGEGGYDYEFSPPADARFVCPVCMLVMRRPVQTPCGHRFCTTCIGHWIRENSCSDCPTCKDRLDELSLFQDNFAHREILSLTVKCPNVKTGCTVIIELRNIQAHLKSDCPYALCRCPNRCPAVLLKKDLEHHLKTACTSRKLRCTLCGASFLVVDQEHHLKSCPKKLEVCPLCGRKVPQREVKVHQDIDCPSKVVACFFQPFGCDHQCTRENLKSHIDNETVDHLQLVADHLMRLQSHGTSTPMSASSLVHPASTMDAPVNLVAIETSENEHQVIREPGCGLGGATMTTDRGFVSGNPASAVSPAALSASAWTGLPLISSSSGVVTDPMRGIRTTRERELERTVAMLQRTVSDQAARIALLEQKLGDPDELVARQNVGGYVWQITNVAQRRIDAMTRSGSSSSATAHSPCFYTSAAGYKLCLRVNLNGVDSGIGRYLAIFVHVNRGAFDSILDWPFSGVISLRVVDQSDAVGSARQHIVESLEAKPGLAAFQRPVSARNHRGFGFVEFAHLSVLDDARYVRNDTLIIHAVAKEMSLSSRT